MTLKKCPTLAQFAELEFVPFVETDRKEKPRTIKFYKMCVSRLKTLPQLWNATLDTIRTEDITAYIARLALEMGASTT